MSNSAASSPSLEQAPLLHVDLDAFFASVEVLDDPSLRGKPVVVGGAGGRGVVASASYEARRYGIRSAMPSVTAQRLCPSLIMLPGRFDRYEAYSAKFHAIVNDLTPNYEALSLDEVFIDVRGLRALGVTPMQAAWQIHDRLRDELSLRCGVGVGRNKLFAKLGSKEAKPKIDGARMTPGYGVFWVDPDIEERWLHELPVRALWGVGPATANKLHHLGLRFVRDLRSVDVASLSRHVGPAMASTLVAFAHGDDPREVQSQREMKSIGHDQTFAHSVTGVAALLPHIRHHAGVVARALRGQGRVARTVTIGLRFDDLTMVQRSQTLSFGLDDEEALAAIATALVSSVPLRGPVRLLALHASSLLDRTKNEVQLSFDVASGAEGREAAEAQSRQRQVTNEALRDAVDEIRARYGVSAVAHASQLREGVVEVERQRGSHAFGPDATDEP